MTPSELAKRAADMVRGNRSPSATEIVLLALQYGSDVARDVCEAATANLVPKESDDDDCLHATN